MEVKEGEGGCTTIKDYTIKSIHTNQLVWYRRSSNRSKNNNKNKNKNGNDDDNDCWWPALLYPSYMEVCKTFSVKDHPQKNKLNRKLITEVLNNDPKPVVRLLLEVDNNNNDNNTIAPTIKEIKNINEQIDYEFATKAFNMMNKSTKLTQVLQYIGKLIIDDDDDDDDDDADTDDDSDSETDDSGAGDTSVKNEIKNHQESSVTKEKKTSQKKSPVQKESEQTNEVEDSFDNGNGINDEEMDNVEEAENEPTIHIEPNDSWDTIWEELKKHGWYKRAEGVTNFYVKPGCSIEEPEYKDTVHYFSTEHALQTYIRTQYPHWKGGTNNTSSRRVSINAPYTPAYRTKPQDPAIPLLSASSAATLSTIASTSSEESSVNSDEKYIWTKLWERLKNKGWSYKKAKHLQDYWYLKPGKTLKNGILGVDYFESQDDVINYIKKQDDKKNTIHIVVGKPNQKPLKKTKKSNLPKKKIIQEVTTSPKQTNNNNNNIKSNNSKKRKTTTQPAVVTTSKKKSKTNNKTSTKKSPKSAKKKKNNNDQHWWKYESIPSNEEIIPLLERMEFTISEKGYHWPDNNDIKEPFSYITGLRKFLCNSGVPCSFKKLTTKQKELFTRWVSFANVPVTCKNSIEQLKDVPSPKNDQQIMNMLYKFGFRKEDNRLFVPDYQALDGGRTIGDKKRHFKEGVHYIKVEDLHTKIRDYVRCSWRFGLMYETEDERFPDDVYEVPDMPKIKANDYIKLRLWGAVSSKDLPILQSVPQQRLLEPYQKMTDLDDSDEEQSVAQSSAESSVEEEEEEESAESAAEEEENEDESLAESSSSSTNTDDASAEVETTATSPEKSVTTVETKDSICYDDPEWYKRTSVPDFRIHIWDTLSETLGFEWKKGRYWHPKVGAIGLSDELREFLVREGIPNLETSDIQERERILLFRWVTFAFVDVKPSNSIEKLSKVEIPEDRKIRVYLSNLGFQTLDGYFYPPGADKASKRRPEKGIHKFYGLEGIRVFLRSHRNWSLIDEMLCPAGNDNATKKEILGLRLWAALSTAKLPIFQPKKYEKSCKESDDNEIVNNKNQDISQANGNVEKSSDKDVHGSKQACVEESEVNSHYEEPGNDVSNSSSQSSKIELHDCDSSLGKEIFGKADQIKKSNDIVLDSDSKADHDESNNLVPSCCSEKSLTQSDQQDDKNMVSPHVGKELKSDISTAITSVSENRSVTKKLVAKNNLVITKKRNTAVVSSILETATQKINNENYVNTTPIEQPPSKKRRKCNEDIDSLQKIARPPQHGTTDADSTVNDSDNDDGTMEDDNVGDDISTNSSAYGGLLTQMNVDEDD